MNIQDVTNGAPQSNNSSMTSDNEARGNLLFIVFSALLIAFFALYLRLHLIYPGGMLAPVEQASANALAQVEQANALLAAAQEALTPEQTSSLREVVAALETLVPRLGQERSISAALSAIDLELDQQPPSRTELGTLFVGLENEIRVGPGYYLWSIGPDRWVEMAFWSLFGTLIFLLSELKYWSCHEGSDFVKFSMWYFGTLLRGPLIALFILLALTSVAVDFVGITFDVNQSPIEVLIFIAAILGFYSREANQVLDDIVAKVFPAQWKKTHKLELAVTPPEHSLGPDEYQQFYVDSSRPIRWWLSGPGEIVDGRYQAPGEVDTKTSVLVMAETSDADSERQRGQAEVTLIPPTSSQPEEPASQVSEAILGGLPEQTGGANGGEETL